MKLFEFHIITLIKRAKSDTIWLEISGDLEKFYILQWKYYTKPKPYVNITCTKNKK